MVSKFREFQGGVEAHIRDLTDGLTRLGHEVQLFTSEDVPGGVGFNAEAVGFPSRVRSLGSLFWNSRARELLEEKIRDFQPDLLHYHSIYHQLSPSVLGVSSLPALMTLHDYKLVAPCYSLYRDSAVCTDCVGLAVALPAIKNRCVKGSALASAVCTAEQWVYKKRYIGEVDKFIVPSAFLRNMLVASGVAAMQMKVVPWGVPTAAHAKRTIADNDGESRYFLYAGRLHESKGLNQVLEAWSRMGPNLGWRLLIAGGGALEQEVRNAAASDASVEYLGVMQRGELLELVAEAAATLVTSIVPETMGLSALESLTRGTPVVSTGRGALADLSGAGVIEVDPESLVQSLTSTFTRIISDPGVLRRERSQLAARDLSIFSQESMVTRIVSVYEGVLNPGSADD